MIIGKADNGKPVGIRNAAELLERLPNQVRDLLGIVVDIRRIQESEHELLAIQVEPYPTPISYKGQYHYRSGSTKQELKGAALDRFLLRKQGKHWDGVPLPYLQVEDLDKSALTHFRALALYSKRLSESALALDDQGLLEKLQLFENGYLKRATALLFHPEPEKFVTGAYVKIGYFGKGHEIRYQDEIHGPLLSQLEQTLETLLLKYLKAWISYDGLQRVETYPVPRPALREALLNAITHKDYSSGTPIQIRVYEDQIILSNTGQLPDAWTVEKLTRFHTSKPFNPDIANTFFAPVKLNLGAKGLKKCVPCVKQMDCPGPSMKMMAP